MTDQNLPAGIGPHEGREFTLMRDGQKNLALFFEIEPDGLACILQDGFGLLQAPVPGMDPPTLFTRIVYRPGYEAQALRLLELTQMTDQGFDAEREHEIGRLLSYTQDEVEAFLRHVATHRRPE